MDSSPRQAANHPTARSAHRVEYTWAVTVLLAAGFLYFWTATSAGSPFSTKLQHDDVYNRLADGFLAGQLSFLEKPDPALEALSDPWDPDLNASIVHYHDVSYFHGRYFLYFGPAPALVLLAPWKALTGYYVGENVAAAVFSFLGAAAGVGLVMVLRRRHFPSLPAWIGGMVLTAVAFGNFALPLLRRPVVYELAIASAYAFSMAALLCVALALGAPSSARRRLWLVLGSIAYGLAVASRPNTVFGAVVLGIILIPDLRAWQRTGKMNRKGLIADASAAVGPFLAIIEALLWYNQARFGKFYEFGTSYELSGMHPTRDVFTSFKYLPVNSWFYLFAPAQFSAFFPFFQVIHMPWFHLPAGYIGEENMYGIIPNMPFFWLALVPLWARSEPRQAPMTALKDLSAGILVLVGLDYLVLSRLSGASSRYLVDLLPPLVTLACVGVFWIEQRSEGIRRLAARAFWIAALLYTAFFNLFVSFQHNDLLLHYNPSAYRTLAHGFDHLSLWLGETSPSKVGPLLIRVRFPNDKRGQLEPLVVTGLSFKADFIYLYYTDDRHIQVGFEHTSYGGALTKPPIEVDYAKDHSVEVEMGSLYPPLDHPYYDNVSYGEIGRLKHTLRVLLDGKEVLRGNYAFYDSSPGDVTVGKNTVSDAFGVRFTGNVLDVARVPAARDQ